MHFQKAHTKFFLRTPSFRIPGVQMNNLAPKKNCPGGVRQPKFDGGVLRLKLELVVRDLTILHANNKGADQTAHDQRLCY